MKIYVATSWRNEKHSDVVQELRKAGHEVYDFKRPGNGYRAFHWSEVDPNWQTWDGEQFRKALTHMLPESSFQSDITALKRCDVCLLLLPCGRSSHLEAGYAAGAGRPVIVLLDEKHNEPELSYKMTPFICVKLCEVMECLRYLDGRAGL